MHWFRNICSFIHTAKKKLTKIITSNVGKLRHLVRAESHKKIVIRGSQLSLVLQTQDKLQ